MSNQVLPYPGLNFPGLQGAMSMYCFGSVFSIPGAGGPSHMDALNGGGVGGRITLERSTYLSSFKDDPVLSIVARRVDRPIGDSVLVRGAYFYRDPMVKDLIPSVQKADAQGRFEILRGIADEVIDGGAEADGEGDFRVLALSREGEVRRADWASHHIFGRGSGDMLLQVPYNNIELDPRLQGAFLLNELKGLASMLGSLFEPVSDDEDLSYGLYCARCLAVFAEIKGRRLFGESDESCDKLAYLESLIDGAWEGIAAVGEGRADGMQEFGVKMRAMLSAGIYLGLDDLMGDSNI